MARLWNHFRVRVGSVTLVLILFVSISAAQVESVDRTGEHWKGEYRTEIAQLLFYWDAYCVKCYADSTVSYHIKYVEDLSIGQAVQPIFRYREVWSHHQPTLEGFMEYLRGELR